MEKLIHLECPSCGANLSIKEHRKVLFCEYCGAKLILEDDNEHIYRYINEANLKKAETEQIIKLKKLELLEKKEEQKRKFFKVAIIITLVGILIAIISYIIASKSGNSDHWGYMVSMCLAMGIMWLWLGIYSFFENKKHNKE